MTRIYCILAEQPRAKEIEVTNKSGITSEKSSPLTGRDKAAIKFLSYDLKP